MVRPIASFQCAPASIRVACITQTKTATAPKRQQPVQPRREPVVAVAEVGGGDVPAVELPDRDQVDHRDQQADPAGPGGRVQEDVALAVGEPGARRRVLEERVQQRVPLLLAARRPAGRPASGGGRRG